MSGKEQNAVGGSLKSRQADWLDVHGGYVLLAGGLMMIGIAILLADEVAVAPIFTTFGCGLVVLAAFYSRIEGPVKATRQGVAAAVGAAQRLSQDRGFPAEVQEEAVTSAVEKVESVNLSLRMPGDARRAGEEAAAQAVEKLAGRIRRTDLIEDFIEWLVEDAGFPIEEMSQEVETSEGPINLVAKKKDEALIAEMATNARMLGAGNVFRLLHVDIPELTSHAKIRRAFVVPLEQEDELRISDIAELGSMEVYGISPEGKVKRLI